MPPSSTSEKAAVREALRKYWGFDQLRALQAEAIQAGLDQRDALVVLPTGGGKSLCYQVPAVVAGRLDLVISPLISLMKDQVDALQAGGYPAGALHSGQTPAERRKCEDELRAGRLRLLFLAPERLQNPAVVALLGRAGVRAIAVDEAHCISHWGHDFRPEYRQLAALRERFPQASLHGFTATATARVRDDIARQLRLRDPLVLVGRFDRPNLVYRILPKQDVARQVLQVLRRHAGQAAIVYCLSRADTEDLAGYLAGQGIRAAHYHAGLDAGTRRKTQDDFAAERLDVVVATVAFGMGIDRSDVRAVVHAALPKSIEHYQQETGRAGRDGLEAECVLFYSYADVARWEGLIEKSAAEAGAPPEVAEAARQLLGHMQGLCSGYTCRHRRLSEYFGQAYERPNCGACDVCLDEVAGLTDATVTAQKILSCVARVGQRFGVVHVVDVLRGAETPRIRDLGHARLSTFGLLKEHDKKLIQSLVHQLLDQGVLARSDGDYPVLKLNAASWEVLRGERAVRLRQAAATVKTARVEEDAWGGVDRGLFEHLRGVRLRIAQEDRVPPFVVLADTVLRDLARFRPTTTAGLGQIQGLGQKKLVRYGQRLLDGIRVYCREHSVGTDVLDASDAPVPAHRSTRPPRNQRVLKRAFELYAGGASVEQVAAETGRVASTAWGYLEQYVAQHQPRDISRWVPPATYARITAAVRRFDGGALRPVFEQLGGEVPYEEIRVALRHLEVTAGSGAPSRDAPAP